MRKVVKYQLVVLFFGILILPFINDGLNLFDFERKDENRAFRDSLSISISKLDKFPKDAEAYINDNFSFRKPLLRYFSQIKYFGFGVSPKPKETVVGKDGWMFMAGNEAECYSGRKDLTKDQLDSLSAVWQQRRAYLESKKMNCYWLIAPIKHGIYSSKLPFNIVKLKNVTRVEQVKQALESKFPDFVVDPSKKLRNQAKKEKVFYKMDNHWNFRAGYIATKELLEIVKLDFPQIHQDYNVEWKDTVLKEGFQYNVLGLNELSEADYIPIIQNKKAKEVDKFGFQPPKDFAYSWEFERHFKNTSAKNSLKVLVIRDSFGEQMMPFISEQFRETLFIFDKWEYKLNKDIIEKFQPDLVIFITVENFIESLIKEYQE